MRRRRGFSATGMLAITNSWKSVGQRARPRFTENAPERAVVLFNTTPQRTSSSRLTLPGLPGLFNAIDPTFGPPRGSALIGRVRGIQKILAAVEHLRGIQAQDPQERGDDVC